VGSNSGKKNPEAQGGILFHESRSFGHGGLIIAPGKEGDTSIVPMEKEEGMGSRIVRRERMETEKTLGRGERPKDRGNLSFGKEGLVAYASRGKVSQALVVEERREGRRFNSSP